MYSAETVCTGCGGGAGATGCPADVAAGGQAAATAPVGEGDGGG